MIRLYVFLLDFLIPFSCDPDLQCVNSMEQKLESFDKLMSKNSISGHMVNKQET